MKRSTLMALALVLTSSVAFAHGGVKNPAVKARMDAMSDIGAEMKKLALMAKGTQAFDADVARAAASAIAKNAAKTSDLFRANESDPKSEAKPSIWGNFDDFIAKSGELESTALKLSNSIAKLDDLKPAMIALGVTCKSCHSTYRD